MKLVARIDSATGLVLNTECASDEWLAANQADKDHTFIVFDEDTPANIGDSWDDAQGFTPPDTVTVTKDELLGLGVESSAIDQLQLEAGVKE